MPLRVASCGVILLLSCALRADYQTGLDAYGQGDYATAMREWRAVTDGPPTAVSPGVFVETHYAIAMLYWEGQGVAQDYRQAHDWLLKAADLNHAGAQAKLGFLYTDGKGVAQDHAQAFEWFNKAAKQGNVDALYNLGVFYLYGWGTEPDTTMAKQYLAAASALGDEAAEQALQNLLAAGPEVGARLAGDSPPADTLPSKNTSPATRAPTAEPDGAEAKTADAETQIAVIPEAAQPLSGIHDEAWILARNPQHYTLQVIILSSVARLEALISSHENLAPFAVYQVQSNGKSLYALVQGDYPDLASAQRARDAFPPAIEKPAALWIRSFAKVQEQIRG